MAAIYIAASSKRIFKAGCTAKDAASRVRLIQCPRGGRVTLAWSFAFDDAAKAYRAEAWLHRILLADGRSLGINEWYRGNKANGILAGEEATRRTFAGIRMPRRRAPLGVKTHRREWTAEERETMKKTLWTSMALNEAWRHVVAEGIEITLPQFIILSRQL